MSIHFAKPKRGVARTVAGVAAVAVATALALSGCSTAPKPESATIALTTLATDNALPWQTNAATAPVFAQVFDTLWGVVDSTGKPTEGLASAVDTSNPLQLKFTLRQNIQFQKGYGTMTAADVVWNVQQWIAADAKGSLSVGVKPFIKDVSSPDANTVIINLTRANWGLLDTIASQGYITSKAYVEKVGAAVASKEPVGTGPYEFTSAVAGASKTFTANANYWGKQKPQFKTLNIKVIPDAATQVSALQAGEIDVVSVSGNNIAATKGAGFNILSNKGAAQFWVTLPGLSGSNKPDYNPAFPWVGAPDAASQEKATQVRKAMAMAIDKQQIVSTVFGGYGNTDSFGFYVYPGYPGYSKDWAPLKYDPKAAKEMLAAAGYPNGFEINLSDTSQTGDTSAVTQAVAQYWNAIGLKVNQAKFDLPKAIADVGARAKTWNYAIVYQTAGQILPSTVVGQRTDGVYRFTAASAELDKLVLPAVAEQDPTKRAALIQTFTNELVSKQYALQIASRDATFAVSKNIKSWDLQVGNGNPNNYQYLIPNG